jgi:hypothetical protein
MEFADEKEADTGKGLQRRGRQLRRALPYFYDHRPSDHGDGALILVT